MASGGMSSTDVLDVVHSLTGAGCRIWVGGGWGVDALAGRQTRPHRDLDLALDATHEAVALDVLIAGGYRIETDWRPVRVELAAPDDRWVDLHPLVFDENGDGVQAGLDGAQFRYPAACFVTGRIAGQVVPCLSVDQQVAFHAGYEPRAVDVADLRVLHDLRRDAGRSG